MHHNVEDHILSKLRNSEPDGVSDLDVGWLCASGKWSWWRWCVIVNRKEDCILNPEPWPPPWPRSSLTPLPQTLSLAVGCVRWFPPSAGSHHFTPTWSLCGPENRPNPLGPRWHQVTHIVRFATHPAQKSISEQMSLLKMERPSSTKVQLRLKFKNFTQPNFWAKNFTH